MKCNQLMKWSADEVTNWWSDEQMKWHFPTSMTTFKVQRELPNYSDAFRRSFPTSFGSFKLPKIWELTLVIIFCEFCDNWGLKIWISKFSELCLIWFVSGVPNNVLFKNSSKLIWVQFWTAVRLDLFAVYRRTNRKFRF